MVHRPRFSRGESSVPRPSTAIGRKFLLYVHRPLVSDWFECSKSVPAFRRLHQSGSLPYRFDAARSAPVWFARDLDHNLL
jgi:hypothetical protein